MNAATIKADRVKRMEAVRKLALVEVEACQYAIAANMPCTARVHSDRVASYVEQMNAIREEVILADQ